MIPCIIGVAASWNPNCHGSAASQAAIVRNNHSRTIIWFVSFFFCSAPSKKKGRLNFHCTTSEKLEFTFIGCWPTESMGVRHGVFSFSTVQSPLWWAQHSSRYSYFVVCNYTTIFSLIVANSDLIVTTADKQAACIRIIRRCFLLSGKWSTSGIGFSLN